MPSLATRQVTKQKETVANKLEPVVLRDLVLICGRYMEEFGTLEFKSFEML